jgi:hypothetical protein
MAWIYKHPKSGCWFIGWRVGKKAFNRSTGTADGKEAETQLATCEIMVTTSREGKLTEAVFRSLTGQSVQRVAFKPIVAAAPLRGFRSARCAAITTWQTGGAGGEN